MNRNEAHQQRRAAELAKELDRTLWDEEGKQAINELLFRFLPGNTTINEVERLACDIHARIEEMWG